MDYQRLEAPAHDARGFGALCYVIFLGTWEWGMVIPTLFPLLRRMEAPQMYFGLVIGTFSLTRMLCQPLVGAMGDRFDFKVLLCCCLSCSALGGVGYALARSPWQLLLSRIICGLGASCTPLLFAWTARALRGVPQVAAAQVKLNTARSVGTFIGPFSSIVLGVLPQEGLFNELNSAGWGIALANLLGLVVCWYFVDDPVLPTKEPQATQKAAEGAGSVCKLAVWVCLLFQVVTALLLAVLEVVPPIVLTNEFRLPPRATSLLFGFTSLSVLGLFAITGALTGRFSGRSLMCVGVASIALGACLAQQSWELGGNLLEFVLPWFVLAVVPAPLIRTPARTLYTSHLPSSVQGLMQGVSEAAFSFANFLGPILGSYVAGAGGLPALRGLMALLVAMELALLLAGFASLVPGTELQK
ncbi:unnamed protein product [Effrenium voratum]|nr:unnamed protein product [Effrenium voratum]